MEKKKFVDEFKQLLADNGDMYFSVGSTYEDYVNITGTLMVQGYWAGTRLRYYFDKDFNFLETEERIFG